jgi:hypothetical protein
MQLVTATSRINGRLSRRARPVAAALIRKALEYIPKEQLVISIDYGFGREGLSRRIAFYKCVVLVEGTNIVCRELGLPEARVGRPIRSCGSRGVDRRNEARAVC